MHRLSFINSSNDCSICTKCWSISVYEYQITLLKCYVRRTFYMYIAIVRPILKMLQSQGFYFKLFGNALSIVLPYLLLILLLLVVIWLLCGLVSLWQSFVLCTSIQNGAIITSIVVHQLKRVEVLAQLMFTLYKHLKHTWIVIPNRLLKLYLSWLSICPHEVEYK